MGGREIPVELNDLPEWEQDFLKRNATPADVARIREFASGATRDTEKGKLDFEAFLSPEVLCRYAEYMDKHRTRSDGTLRDGDDWQAGMPFDAYMKSLLRHVIDAWLIHRDNTAHNDPDQDMEDLMCAIIFNAMGYLFNLLQGIDPA